MHQISTFENKLCHILRHHLDLVAEDCDIYSIWTFWPGARWRTVKDLFLEKPLCPAAWFPVIYWMVLAVSIWGCVYSFAELATLLWTGRKRLSMWRSRKYRVLPYTVLRKCRLVGALIMLNAWLSLLYAVVNVSPSHMTPWLTINMFVLAFELVTWIVELLVGVSRMDLHTLFSFALLLANYLFVRCVRNVFQMAIDMDDVDELRLWKMFK